MSISERFKVEKKIGKEIYEINDSDLAYYNFREKKLLAEMMCKLLNHQEYRINDLLYQIGEMGKNNKTCENCISYNDDIQYCTMWDMETKYDDVVIQCDQRKEKNV
jgi:hypothetical protein